MKTIGQDLSGAPDAFFPVAPAHLWSSRDGVNSGSGLRWAQRWRRIPFLTRARNQQPLTYLEPSASTLGTEEGSMLPFKNHQLSLCPRWSNIRSASAPGESLNCWTVCGQGPGGSTILVMLRPTWTINLAPVLPCPASSHLFVCPAFPWHWLLTCLISLRRTMHCLNLIFGGLLGLYKGQSLVLL